MKCQNVRTLINTAKRSEPMNGMVKTHLGSCPDCRRFSDETSSLLTLLKAQPKVQAPADFDFRLRARIARVQSDQRSTLSFLEKFWARSFTWGQAATALATLALAVTLTTLHITRNNRTTTTPTDIAVGEGFATKPATVQTVTPDRVASPATAPAIVPSSVAVKSYVKSTRALPIVIKPEESVVPVAPVVRNDESWRGYNGQRKQYVSVPNREFLGAETSASGMAKTVAFVPSI